MSSNPTKDQDKPFFFKLKVEPKDVERRKGSMNQLLSFFLIYFPVDDHFDYFGGHIGYDFGTTK